MKHFFSLVLTTFFMCSIYAQQKTLEWAKMLDGTSTVHALGTTVDKFGNTYYTGPFDQTADFDPGADTFNMTSTGIYNIFVVKLDIEGRFQWAKRLGGTGNCQGYAIATDNAGNVFTTGFFQGTGDFDPGNNTFNLTATAGDEIFVSKLDQRGDFVWAKKIGGGGNDRGYAITTDASGNVLLGGYFSSTVDFDPGAGTLNQTVVGTTDMFICKLSNSGNFVWAKTQGSPNVESVTAIKVDVKGNINTAGFFNGRADFDPGIDTFYLTPASSNSDVFVSRLDSSGNFIRAARFGSTADDRPGNKIELDEENNVFIAGHFNGTTDFDPGLPVYNLTSAGDDDIYVTKLDSTFAWVWSKRMGGTLSDRAYSIAIDKKRNLYITGYIRGTVDMDPGAAVFNLAAGYDIFVTKLDADGNFVWAVKAGGTDADDGNGITIDGNNSITVSGRFRAIADFGLGQGTYNINTNGGAGDNTHIFKIRQANITGKVYLDINQNCTSDTAEIGMAGRLVHISPIGLITRTSAMGVWAVDSLPAGNYTITVDSSGKWIGSCGLTRNFTVVHPDSILIVTPSVGMVNTQPCAQPNISIHMPRLRFCITNQPIYVQACNEAVATGALNGAYADVQLDSLLIVTGASIPYTHLGNNIFRFNLDTINPGFCKTFTISATVSCSSTLGQALCMKAKLFPVDMCVIDTSSRRYCPDAITTCNTSFDGSNIFAYSYCTGDSIYLIVKNENVYNTSNMNCPLPVHIYRDGVLMIATEVQLIGGDSIIYKFKADGRTWRIGSTQHPLHPRHGCPRSTLEACGDTSNWVPNLVNVLPVNEVENIEATFCGEVRGSYDPNDKTGYPLGISASHFIAPNQQMEYLINFQNTGNDTAYIVVLRDTLDTDFDIFTVRSGVASHNYDFRMYGQRVLEWTFNNILLTDSGTNEPASHGFVKFTVQQNKDLPNNTEFNNRVGIYFDFNDPIITNTTSHLIDRSTFTTTGVNEGLHSIQPNIVAYPNPTTGILTLQGMKELKSDYKVNVTNVFGETLLQSANNNSDLISVNLSYYTAGIYFIQIAHTNGTAMLKVIKE